MVHTLTDQEEKKLYEQYKNEFFSLVTQQKLEMDEEFCIYLRKSRADIEAEARGEGETFIRHLRNLLDLALRQKIYVAEIYKELVSGETIEARPVIQHVISEVEDGKWQGVLVMEIERLARGDTIDQGTIAQTFKYSGTKIITPTKTYDPNNEFDEEYFEFGLYMSRREYKTINRRQQRGRMDSAKEGKYTGNISPFGYKRVKLEKTKGYTLEIVPEEARIVRLIYEWYTKGEPDQDGVYHRLGTALIARKLNDLGIPSAKGGVWTVPTVRDILRNPVYNGKIKFKSRPLIKKKQNGKIIKSRPRAKKEDMILVDGLHPAIVDETTWNLAQEIMSKNPRKPVSVRSKISNPLAGLVVCGVCGRKMIRRPHKGRPDTLMCQLPSCGNVSSFLDLVEQRILAGLKEWLKNYKAEWDKNVPVNNDAKNKVMELKIESKINQEKKLAELEQQLENAFDLVEQKVYDVDTFRIRSQQLKSKINDCKEALSKIEQEIALEKERTTARVRVIPQVEHVLDAYYKTDDPEIKNELLKSVLETSIYLKTKKARWNGSLDDFKVTLFPKLPQ
ncbi:serine recombinase [Paenibacillus macerans]|uniref:recombinase family protein n=1 Tax=Paenibacillus macerans TaxID=44252 RepID=UPI001B134F6D|nr:recombinase family protein [Paenibacillus macerans]GIP08801.1 serine recombinase [Paenibacillus macerans]